MLGLKLNHVSKRGPWYHINQRKCLPRISYQSQPNCQSNGVLQHSFALYLLSDVYSLFVLKHLKLDRISTENWELSWRHVFAVIVGSIGYHDSICSSVRIICQNSDDLIQENTLQLLSFDLWQCLFQSTFFSKFFHVVNDNVILILIQKLQIRQI